MEVDELPKEKKNPPPKQQSDLQQQLDVDNLVNKVLGTPMTVTLCELLGTSPTASKKILDYLCITRPTQHIAAENVNSLKSHIYSIMTSLRCSIPRPIAHPIICWMLGW